MITSSSFDVCAQVLVSVEWLFISFNICPFFSASEYWTIVFRKLRAILRCYMHILSNTHSLRNTGLFTKVKEFCHLHTVKSHWSPVCSRGGLVFNTVELWQVPVLVSTVEFGLQKETVFLDEQFKTPHTDCRFLWLLSSFD